MIEAPDNLAGTLRDLEQDAPAPTSKAIRAALIQAATRIESYKREAEFAIHVLEEAAALRVGQMDSASRADEVSRNAQHAMRSVAERLKGLL